MGSVYVPVRVHLPILPYNSDVQEKQQQQKQENQQPIVKGNTPAHKKAKKRRSGGNVTTGKIKQDTPLDQFFKSFTDFDYNPLLPPGESYQNLREFYDWRRGEPESDSAWAGYGEALQREIEQYFGDEDDINAWHTLCRAIGIRDPPASIGGCKNVRDSKS